MYLPPALLLAAGAYAAGAVADMFSTHVALKRGLKEWNPLVGKRPVLVSGLVTAATLAFALIAVALQPSQLNTAIWFCGVFAVYRFGCAAWNVSRIRKLKKERA